MSQWGWKDHLGAQRVRGQGLTGLRGRGERSLWYPGATRVNVVLREAGGQLGTWGMRAGRFSPLPIFFSAPPHPNPPNAVSGLPGTKGHAT